MLAKLQFSSIPNDAGKSIRWHSPVIEFLMRRRYSTDTASSFNVRFSLASITRSKIWSNPQYDLASLIGIRG